MCQPEITVIIPCYNSYKHMQRCLESLERQQYKNFEVIVVDDCSTDDSYHQLKMYAQNSSLNMSIVSNEKNRGPGFSRNVGIKLAKGRWLSFCDADDWYPDDRLEKVSKKINNADCILCNYTKVYLSGKEEAVNYISKIKSITNKDELIVSSLMSFWICIIRKEIAEKFPIAELYNGEDYATIPLWIQNSKKIEFIDEGMYFYYMRENSASRNPTKKAYIGLCNAFRYMASNSLPEFATSTEFLGVHYVLYGAVLSAIKAGVDKVNIKKVVSDFEQRYPLWHDNVYIKTLPRYKKFFLKTVKKKHFTLLRIMTYIHTLLLKLK